VRWDNTGPNEYVLVGDGIKVDVGQLQALIDAKFSTPVLWSAPTRHKAQCFPRQSAAAEIAAIVEAGTGVTVCDEQLHVFLEVSTIGVARTGVAQANYAFKPTPSAQLN
jgi:hypothetical protein